LKDQSCLKSKNEMESDEHAGRATPLYFVEGANSAIATTTHHINTNHRNS
jgi:hypothetical protein